jgi:two-component system CheB/CheR fusion protein
MRIRPYRTADNRLAGAVLSFVDVDALKIALRGAEVARDYARSIVETVTSALVVLDDALAVVSANQAFIEMLGVSPGAADTRSLFGLAGGLFDLPTLHRALGDLLAYQTPFSSLELTRPVDHSRRRVLSLTGRAIAWGGGAPMVLLAIDDITELRRLEAERSLILESEKQARFEAERANRAKDLFLATLSHELRTPLATVLLSAEVLSMTAADDPRVQRASASIERAARAQSRLIDDLLDVSRIVSGKLMLDLGPVDLALVVREAVDAARPSAEAKGVDLELVIEDHVGAVYGDAARLLQVANNLLTNAIKFTPRGGHISVRLDANPGQAQLTVADSGMGIRPEVLPQLFSRFVQADSSVTRTHGGLGLGLAIVRHLVEAQGGVVQAESPGEGKGATFRVILPVGSQRTAAPAARQVTVQSIAGIRVLLVEDNDDTRQACSAMLTELGADVQSASSAAAGLAELERFQPQVILSDIAMPGEDGFSFIEKVRRREPERGGRVPAAALTALASEEDRQRALQAGFQLHVAKPVDSARLATIVSMLAAWKQPLAQATEQLSIRP